MQGGQERPSSGPSSTNEASGFSAMYAKELMGWSYGMPSATRQLPPIPIPHRMLHDLLLGAPAAKAGKWSASTRAGVVRCIFFTFLQDPEWLRFFELDGDNDGKGPPIQWTLAEWVAQLQTGDENFSLAEFQRKIRLARRSGSEKGKERQADFPKPRRRGKICGKTLKRYDRTYTCRTCALDPSAVMCVDCFQASDHEGHDVLFGQSFSFSSACDCGDPEIWKDRGSLGCSHHPPALDDSDAEDERTLTTNADIPIPLMLALYKTIRILLDYVIHTLSQTSWNPNEYSRLPKDEQAMMLRANPIAGVSEGDGSAEMLSVVALSDDKHVMREVVRQIKDATGGTHEQAEKLARELDHTGRKIIATSSQPAVVFHVASMLNQIEIGVAIRRSWDAFREELTGLIIAWLADMCQVTIGGDDELFRRLLFKALLETRERPGATLLKDDATLYEHILDLKFAQAQSRLHHLFINDIKLWKKPKWEMRQMYNYVYTIGPIPRQQLALHFVMRYRKFFEDFALIEREADTNLLFCMSYMIWMNELATAFALSMKDVISDIVTIAVGWYTDQVKGLHIANPVQPLLRPEPIKEPNPDKPTETRVRFLNIEDGSGFRHKKGFPLLNHLQGIMHHPAGQRFVASNPRVFDNYAGLLNMFVGMQPQRRELEQHVLFEAEWTKPFGHMTELARNAKSLGKSLKLVEPERIATGMAQLVRRIWDDAIGESEILTVRGFAPLYFDHVERDVLYVGAEVTMVALNTLTITHFTFHEYLHLALAEAVKAFRSFESIEPSKPDLSDTFDEVIRIAAGRGTPYEHRLAIFEAPIRKFAVLAHIKADLWRRNGVCMRAQLHHYREVMIRDTTVDQEFWLIQFALCVTDSLTIFTTLINRFALTEFFRGHVTRSEIWDDRYIDPKQAITVLEEFLMLVLHLATDTFAARGAEQDEVTRDYLIHLLAINNLTYSEIIRRLPEPCEKSPIAQILREVADYKEPTDTVGGSYSLKPEMVDEVDPFWHHYSRNDIRKATEKVFMRMKKLDPSVAEPVILPRPLRLPPPSSIFAKFGDWLKDPRILPSIVHYVFAHSIQLSEPSTWPGQAYVRSADGLPQFDLVLDLSLQLAMVAIQADGEGFCRRAIDHIEPLSSLSIFQDLWFMQNHEAFKPFRPKIDYIIDQIVKHLPSAYTQDYRREQEKRAAQAAKEAEEAAAAGPQADAKPSGKRTQAALLAKFQKQQAAFTKSLEGGKSELQALLDEDDEEDEATSDVVDYGPCIVCQDSVTNKWTGGMLALLQPSRIIRELVPDRDWFEESISTPSDLDRATRYQRYGQETSVEPANTDGYPSTHNRFGVYMSACSHIMHESCSAELFDKTRLRHAHQIQRHHPENAVRLEYLCPLCKSLSNGLIPLDATQSKLKPYQPRLRANGRIPTLSERIREVSSEGLLKIRDSAKIWDHHVETGELSAWFSDTIFGAASLDISFRKANKHTSKMIERFRSLLRPLSEQSQRIRGKKTHMYMPDDMVNYTISAYEIAQRGLRTPGETVAEQVPEISLRVVKQLINLLQLELDIFFGLEMDRTALRIGIFARFLPDWYRSSSLPSPVLLRQPLVLVIETAAIAPDMIQPVIVLGYYLELTRVMLGLVIWVKRCLGSRQQPHSRPTPPEDTSLPDALSIFAGFRTIMVQILRNNAGPIGDLDGVIWRLPEEKLAKLLYSQTLPFLRRAAILYYAVAGGYPITDPDLIAQDGCEYRRLMTRLGIPFPVESLSRPTSTEGPIVARWLNQWAMQGRQPPTLEFPGTYELYRLSQKYEDVMIWYADRKCDKCGTRPSFPALCFYCGAYLCMHGDCCAVGEEGELNLHVRTCGAVTGLFIDLRRWLLVYLYVGSGSFGTMPYLDMHGEIDPSMRRGTRQYLQPRRMEEVRKAVWLNHTIPHLIARRLEMSTDHSGWGTL